MHLIRILCPCNGSPNGCCIYFTDVLKDLQRIVTSFDLQNGCFYPKMKCDGWRKFKFQPKLCFINRTWCLVTHFRAQQEVYSERQIFNTKQVDLEAAGSKYYLQQFQVSWTEGHCVMISGFLPISILNLHIYDGRFFYDDLMNLLISKDMLKKIRRHRADCQLTEDSRDGNTDIKCYSNSMCLPMGHTLQPSSMQPFYYDRKEVSEKIKVLIEQRINEIVDITCYTILSTLLERFRTQEETMEVKFRKPAKADINDIIVKAETLNITAQTSDSTEFENLLVKNGNVNIIIQSSGGTEFGDTGLQKESWKATTKTSIITDFENFSIEEETERITTKVPNSTREQDLTREAKTIEAIAKGTDLAENFKFRSVDECWKTSGEALHETDVESHSAECHVIGNEEELVRYNNIVPSDEQVMEQYFGDFVKINDQCFLQATGKFPGDKNEDRRKDFYCYQDIHKGKKQQNESGKILEFVKKKNLKETCMRDRNVTTTASKEGLKKNPDSDISMSFRAPGLSGEKDKIATFFHEDRKWIKSQPSVNSVQQEFTPVTSTDESLLLVTAAPELSYDFISLESEKKKRLSLSKLHIRVTDNNFSFVSRNNREKNAEDKVHLKEGIQLFFFRKQVISSSVRLFFETDNTGLNQTKDTNETEIHIPLDMDVSQKEKCGVGINGRTGTDIDLQKKKKPYLGQILWFPRNWLPLPRLGRDEIVGFVEDQIRDGHGGYTLPPADHKELREMLRQLASDNVPGPQITMKYEMLRLCTMKTFPERDRPFAIRIVGAGFYYAGHKDQVICYCCGNRKEGWVLGDIPLLIHQNMAPGCGFLSNNAVVNVPVRKANCTATPSLAEVRLLTIQRSDGSNQSDTAQGESSMMLPSSEQTRINISNMSHQMLVTNKSTPPYQLVSSDGQSVSDSLQSVSAHSCFMEEQPPKYPQYAVKNMRINSFQGWPAEHQQKPEEMAECGFYFAGFSDCVRCFHCGIGLRHWMSEDDPWIEHARWSTSCLYVLKMKGEEFVSLVKMAVEIAEREEAARSNSGGNQEPEHSSETVPAVTTKEVASSNSSTVNSTPSKDVTASKGITGCNATGAAVSTPSSGNTEIQKYLLTDAAQSVLDMGYQPKLVQQAIEKILLKQETEELTGQLILEEVFQIEEETKVQPKPKQSAQSAEEHKSIGKGAEATDNASSEESKLDLEKIKREHRELHEATLCKICMENTISVVFLPCGHLVTCSDCAPAMRKCPICRTLIKGTVKTFYG
ncbi:hypothetical protein CHS0354_018234 [Potamilus streckersoni]|uniref:RING-type domain-containing protein n=1 Tax=Potamilus streckersoni TaxID=2493646 RepID=A0AAE0SJK3_9BIVA|nr:hypothetical protein CHS0354_018234 [Potamilus streckersoni]